MPTTGDDDGLGRILRAGYGAPPPRPDFVEGLAGRLRSELMDRPVVRAGPRPVDVLLKASLVAAGILLVAAGVTWQVIRSRSGKEAVQPEFAGPVADATPEDVRPKMVLLEVRLPRPLYEGETPLNVPPSPHLEEYSDTPWPALRVPEGTVNLARGRQVTSSDTAPVTGELALVTDGDKESDPGHFVELGPGLQWIQIDLGRPCRVHAVALWHYYAEGRVYHDVVVQVADDADFTVNVRTLFNNDYDFSAGLGPGRDLEYVEDYRGRLIAAGGVIARYVRLYSRGNTSDDLNHYVEVEVYGVPAGP